MIYWYKISVSNDGINWKAFKRFLWGNNVVKKRLKPSNEKWKLFKVERWRII